MTGCRFMDFLDPASDWLSLIYPLLISPEKIRAKKLEKTTIMSLQKRH
jgi:hypothetical protein